MIHNQYSSKSSPLELEAASYFKLNPSQVSGLLSHCDSSLADPPMRTIIPQQNVEPSNNTHQAETMQSPLRTSSSSSRIQTSSSRANPRSSTEAIEAKSMKIAKKNGFDYDHHHHLNVRSKKASNKQDTSGHQRSSRSSKNSLIAYEPSPVLASSAYLDVGSSTTSTNSLPSISSSPSVSPSLVCPHISLDDILALRNGSKSPHTIGLCAECRFDPPPNIHSPLSPAFKPSNAYHHQVPQKRHLSCETKPDVIISSAAAMSHQPATMKRGYSDQQISTVRASMKNRQQRLSMSHRSKEDSLDYCVEPSELRRLQMSPTLRHSVEFIRKNSIEAGRVLKIYKNGQPFEKPLRVCITRGEFSNVNHLLDHINSRQLVPSGARYLFHIDGQLVYSINELKHGSTYIVSGTRSFDFKANSIIKEHENKHPEARTTRRKADLQSQLAAGREDARQVTRPVLTKARKSSLDDLTTAQEKPMMRSSKASEAKPHSHNQANSSATSKKRATVTAGTNMSKKPPVLIKPHMVDESNQTTPVVSQSSENLTHKQDSSNIQVARPVNIVRAKSELSALPKRKKNVTFMDTNSHYKSGDNLSGQSVRQSEEYSADSSLSRGLSTNEIGIQVSDSLEGFLIDLPIPVPSAVDRESKKRSYLRKGQGRRASGSTTTAGNTDRSEARQRDTMRSRRPQIVTISERQLSLDEMDQFKDLDHGDHHSEASKIQHVTIKLDASTETSDREPADESDRKRSDVVSPPDRENTIAIGAEPESDTSSLVASAREKDPQQVEEEDEDRHWQYPGRREASTTPTERPVSQSEANETVHARVTTPTPSLSTLGDSNSLSMSYETQTQKEDQQPTTKQDVPKSRKIFTLPPKQRVPVVGRLCRGINPPEKNIRLMWVNGFAINEQFSLEHGNNFDSAKSSSISGGSDNAHLSPSARQKNPFSATAAVAYTNQFKLSDRFNNWICHSKRHDELIYPVGSLIILWCRWTNEQRYYSKHTTSVSSITLVSLSTDLAASGQVSEPVEKIAPNVHLWSLTKLETLMIVDDDHFRGRRIFSLKVRNSELDGCEMCVAARDDKRLWFYNFHLKLNSLDKDELDKTTPTKQGPSMTAMISNKKQQQQAQPGVVLKTNKLLQSNQVPLLLTRMSNTRAEQQPVGAAAASSTSTRQLDDLMLSFGRRHFQLWLADKKQQKLRLLQPDSRSAKFVETIVSANCLVRMAPTEFLIGDSSGNITLLLISWQTSKSQTFSPDTKYNIQALPLLEATSVSNCGDRLIARQLPAITCLTRISGSLFASSDATCTVKFWKLERTKATSRVMKGGNYESGTTRKSSIISASCRQLSCISLPQDLGFICTIVLSRYEIKHSMVEFYLVSTSNAILFGSVQLQSTQYDSKAVVVQQRDEERAMNILANSSLSVVYEGHETSVMNLVADVPPQSKRARGTNVGGKSPTSKSASNSAEEASSSRNDYYFTCSLDCKICKWEGKNLVWKSMLPSACASLTVHPVGFVLAVGSADGTVYILDKISGLLISYFPLTPVCINCLAYSRDGSLLAAGCANGSIFILPVYERGLKYKKVSIFQSPFPVVSLQFSVNSHYILTSITNGSYQELILWDLPNFRYMRDNVKMTADKIEWLDSICSGSEDVRAIWENANLMIGVGATSDNLELLSLKSPRLAARRKSSSTSLTDSTSTIVNLSCHRLIRSSQQPTGEPSKNNFVIASDTRGYLRLFRYPAYDIQQACVEVRVSSSAVNCCRFLTSRGGPTDEAKFVSTSLDGSICLWALE